MNTSVVKASPATDYLVTTLSGLIVQSLFNCFSLTDLRCDVFVPQHVSFQLLWSLVVASKIGNDVVQVCVCSAMVSFLLLVLLRLAVLESHNQVVEYCTVVLFLIARRNTIKVNLDRSCSRTGLGNEQDSGQMPQLICHPGWCSRISIRCPHWIQRHYQVLRHLFSFFVLRQCFPTSSSSWVTRTSGWHSFTTSLYCDDNGGKMLF